MSRIVNSDIIPPKAIKILNRGFVDLVDALGADITPVNTARVSFGKRVTSFDIEKDGKLLKHLASERPPHTAPFRHVQLQFHIKAPEFIMRQWYKHVIGCEWTSGVERYPDTAWNEISGRYVEYEPEFYFPKIFRPQAKDNKQASADGDLSDVVIEQHENAELSVRDIYSFAINDAYRHYKQLLKAGVSREQARLVLPFSLYTEVYWTASLQAVAHFVKLRQHPHAQWEIQQYAEAVNNLTKERFPNAWQALMEN